MSKRLLLVEWDIADWGILSPMLDRNELPTLNRLVEEGTSGELSSTQPLIPAALCTSMVTGKRPWQHGICHGGELSPDGAKIVPVTSESRRAHTLYQILEACGKRCIQIGWPASHREQSHQSIIVSDCYPHPTAGPGVKPWPPALAGTYCPPDIGKTLDGLRVSPEEIGPEIIKRFVPEWKTIDQKQDRRISLLRLNVAADYSYERVALKLLTSGKWDFAAVRFSAISAIKQIFGEFHSANNNVNNETSFHVYQHVISTSYCLLDEMLRQLIEAAGENTAVMVVSGQGIRFRPGVRHKNPATDENSTKLPFGIFVAAGQGFAWDTLIHGASVLDVTPTILTWFGLPIGEDMEGRVLVEGFAEVPEIKRRESWSSFSGISTLAQPKSQIEFPENAVVLKWQWEKDWNFVQSGMEAGRYEQIKPMLRQLYQKFPEQLKIGNAWYQCQLALKDLTGAAETLEVILEQLPPGIPALIARAELALAENKWTTARQLVHEIYQLNPNHPVVLRKLGIMMLRLREWAKLEQIAKTALEKDERDAIAWLGLATAQLRLGQADNAAESAARAISIKYFLPDAHFILARAFLALGQWDEAKSTMGTYMKLQPENRAATAYYNRMARENN